MSNYLRNIWLAVCGRNPFDEELVQAKKDYEQRLRQETASLQRLVENLRDRVRDMEDNMRIMDSHMRQELRKANGTIGRLMQEKQTLEHRLDTLSRTQEDNFNLD